MLKKALYLFTSVLVLSVLLGMALPAAALTTRPQARGRVVAINRRTSVMIVKTPLGARVRLKYGYAMTRLWHNGVRVGLWHLHVGNVVNASFTPSGMAGVPGTADDVNDNNGVADISGTVAATDTTANTVTIASHEGGSTVVLHVGSSTAIMRNGAPATLADLMFGDNVHATYDSATMIASAIAVADNVSASEVEGSITAIDTVANTITVSGESDLGNGDSGSGSNSNGDESLTPSTVTLNVTSSTVLMLDDSPAPLSSLQVGMQAEAQFDPATMSASFVEAESQSGSSSQGSGH